MDLVNQFVAGKQIAVVRPQMKNVRSSVLCSSYLVVGQVEVIFLPFLGGFFLCIYMYSWFTLVGGLFNVGCIQIYSTGQKKFK